MKTRLLTLAALTLVFSLQPSAFGQGTAFMYQGRLNDGTEPASGFYDFTFSLQAADNGAAPIGAELTRLAVPVTNGLFTVLLDFTDPNSFSGASRWLESGVRTNGAAAFVALSPRQALTAAPYAIRAANISGVLEAGQLTGTVADARLSTNVALRTSENAFNGNQTISGKLGIGLAAPDYALDVQQDQAAGRFTTTDSANGGVLALRNIAAAPTYLGAVNFESTFGTPGQIGYLASDQMTFRVGDAERMKLDASGLSVNGQPVLLAPTGGQPIEFTPDSASAWRLLPNSTSPNIIGGYAGNIVSNGVVGAFIGGGGNASFPNRIGGDYAAVLGGFGNIASGVNATAFGNQCQATGPNSTAFGSGAQAANHYAVAMGGATKAGGASSTAMGLGSEASGDSSTAMGDHAKATNSSATALGSYTTAGGIYSTAMGSRTLAGGTHSTAMGDGTIATGNWATAMGRATVASGVAATAMGQATTASGAWATAMGFRARADHLSSFVWADSQRTDFASTTDNQFNIRASGGVRLNNDTSLNFGNQTRQMLNLWNAEYGIGVQGDAQYFRTGNDFHWYRGGSHSDANGNSGGGAPLMSLSRLGHLGLGTATPSVQLDVHAGQAVGSFTSSGSVNGSVLVLRNSTTSPTYLGAINFETASDTPGQIGYLASGQMSFRVSGAERMTLNSGGLTVNGTFVSASDRNAKENFQPVDAQEVLNKVASLPLSRWNYRDDKATSHLGPMAQDFHAAFGVGPDDKHIATVDADGVALAAIQGLNQKLTEELKQNAKEITELKRTVNELKELVQTINHQLNGGAK